ncbi:hypothetical protein K458DRAFT_300984, partial [Lentithecium fluviatile CBS 122367]
KIQHTKTYNSGDSLVVTHLTTSPPVKCLGKAERTGSPGFIFLWSYVLDLILGLVYIVREKWKNVARSGPECSHYQIRNEGLI